jgi:hypothetical protein
VVTVLAACARDEDAAPQRLLDGSPSREVPVELENIGQPAVLTRVRTVTLDAVEAGSSIRACLQAWKEGAQPVAPLVARVGVHAETVTFRDASSSWLHGCDDSSGPDDAGRWCGRASGRLYSGRLRDPRVDIVGCTSADGTSVGFAWVYPSRDAHYVVVGQPRYAEVYEVAGGLPIRIATTSGVIVERSRARFDLSEHDGEGNLIREYELEAGVAG